jgi:hypothetical protein
MVAKKLIKRASVRGSFFVRLLPHDSNFWKVNAIVSIAKKRLTDISNSISRSTKFIAFNS